MNERFGPWSSALGGELSPHLSTFWKRRLTLLASARSARLGVSRRDCLKLGAAGVAACALPTLHIASADDPKVASPAGSGTIYVWANLRTGEGEGWVMGLFAVDPETSTYNKISDFNANDVRVSRDGRTLAMNRTGKDDNAGVWTLGTDGKGEKRRVTDLGGVISWSPDGKQLIVNKWPSKPGDDEIRVESWRFNIDGTGANKLPIHETDEVDDWSPDGRWLVTVSDRHPPHGRGYQLYLMRPDGTDQRRLTEGKGLNVFARFSPDGRRIAYLHHESDKTSVWIVDVDGGGRRRVVDEVVDEGNAASPASCCWSPDGRSLAYTIEDWQLDEKGKKFLNPDSTNPRIAIVDAEGKNSRPLKLPPAIWINAFDWR
jgi:TolB protein